MSPELIYFLKVNIAIVLFYGFYRLFFHKDTFFQWRRVALLSFLAIAFLYPFLNIQDWVKEHQPMVAMADIYATALLPDVVVTNTDAAPVDWEKIISSVFLYTYLGVGLVLLLRFIAQFGGILKFRFGTQAGYVCGAKVRILTDSSGPFSFFKWIFIRPQDHTTDELDEIMTHELTHARQWHSVDVIIGELVCIICWINPFTWLIRREIRCNLEYLADHKVLANGYDLKSYQYHLLGLTYEKKVATLYNNFNVLPLKNRIKMMNKKRTKGIGRAKYFVFPLLAAILLVISNIEAIARTTEKVSEEAVTIHITDQVSEAAMEQPVTVVSPGADQQDPVFEIVEEMPQYPGGQEALMQFISKNLKYPVTAQEKGIQGRVILSFIVEKDGTVSEPVVARGVDAELDKESLRIVSIMPKWIPGKQRGQAVRVKYTIPVVFRLFEKAPTPPSLPNETKDGEKVVFEIVEKMPEYPGGLEALMKYFADNLQYPVDAKTDKIQGRVIVRYIVDEDGSIKDPEIARSVAPSLDAEAIRLVKSMPKWTPGQQRGVNIAVKYTLPIVFKL